MKQENLTNSQPASQVGSNTSAPKGKIVYKITGVFDLIGKAFELYKTRFWQLIGIMLVSVLGALPMVVIIGLYIGMDFLPLESGVTLTIINVILGLLMVVAIVILIIVAVSAQAGLYIMIKNETKELTIKEAFMEGKKYAWRFFVVNLLMGIFVLLWSILLIIPGIIAAIYYTFAPWLLIDKGDTGTGAIKKSKNMVKGYWWAVFGRLVAIQILLMIITGLPSIVFEVMKIAEAQILWGIVSNLISFLAAPLILIYAYYMYKDLMVINGEKSA